MRAIAAITLGAVLCAQAVQAQSVCPGADGIPGSALTGTWRVGVGAAEVGGSPMFGGTSEITLQATGGGLTLGIDGNRFALDRVAGDAPPFAWETAEGVAVSAEGVEVTLGCRQDELVRYAGEVMMAGQAVSWRIMFYGRDDGVLYWSFPGPPPAQGLFNIER